MLVQKYADLGSAVDKRLLGHREKVNSVTFSSDGHYLGSASMDKSVRIWDVQTMSSGRDLSTSIELKEHEASVEAMTWDPTGPKRLASASSDRTVRLWDLRAQSRSSSRVVKTEGENINLAWSPDGKYLVVGNRDEVLSFIDARTGKVLSVKRSQTEVNEVKWSPSGMLIFLTMQGGKVDVLHWPNMKRLRKIYGHMDRCQCIDFDPKHPRFAVGGADALVSLWDLDELYCIRTFDRCETQVRAVSFSHDGLLLASASEDHFIDIAATDTAKLVHRQPVRSPTNSISWHPNRALLAYAGEDMDNDVSVHVFGFPL